MFGILLNEKNMKLGKRSKIGIGIAIILVVLVSLGLFGASNYMLDYSLGYPRQERMTAEHWKNRIKGECPWVSEWMDSIYQHHCVRDTFVTMPSGYKAHALYLYSPKTSPANTMHVGKGTSASANTAIVVHGYKVRAEGMLHIAYLYNHDMGYNVLLPDLYGHGESEGDHIQMGWNDRWDVIRWSQVAHELFGVKNEEQRAFGVKNEERRVKNSSVDSYRKMNPVADSYLVIHGISMGAATTMAVSGEKTPDYVKCFVEDCGFMSVWDEFAGQLKEQFGLPSFPLMNTTSELCRWKYGWSFAEAQQIAQVRKSTKPMLFIHGDKDDFVPYSMLRPLYEAKTKGRKGIFIAKGSVHAMAYRDHHEEYTRIVREFVTRSLGEE